jgi:SulP family sulfate permease
MGDVVPTEPGQLELGRAVPGERLRPLGLVGANVARWIPALEELRHYSGQTLRRDLLAGLTVAAVAVPQAMAYAAVAGLAPQYGLYTAIVMTAIGAVFASSRQLINGPTNIISIALLSALVAVPEADRLPAVVLLTFLVGLIQSGITLLRLGDLTRYVSQAVIVGFTLGAAVLLVLDQLKNLLGFPARGHAGEHFLKRFWLTMTQAEGIHGLTLLIGAGTILLVLGVRLLNRRLRIQLPEFLLALVVMAVVACALQLDQQGVAVVGDIPAHLPDLTLPVMVWERVQALAGSALAIALLGLLEALAMAKALAVRTGQKLDINQQCLSEGLANLGGSLFQCMPGSGSLTRSTINYQAGAVTQWSGLFSAVAVAAIVLLFRPLAEYVAPLPHYIPRAALAGILMVSAWRLVDRKQLKYHLRATRFDAGIVLVTAVAAVFVSVEFCILVGVFVSFALYVPRAARVHLSELTLTPERVIRERLPDDPPCGRMLLYNIEGELFFGSAPDLEEQLEAIERRAGDGIRVLVLRLKRARNPDAVCLSVLDQFIRRLQARRVRVLLCGVRRDLARVLRTTGLETRLGSEHIFIETTAIYSSTLSAVRRAYELLGSDVCATCPRRDEVSNGKESWYYMI